MAISLMLEESHGMVLSLVVPRNAGTKIFGRENPGANYEGHIWPKVLGPKDIDLSNYTR
jgi:hypothetical protein